MTLEGEVGNEKLLHPESFGQPMNLSELDFPLFSKRDATAMMVKALLLLKTAVAYRKPGNS
jgi:hypothetical protein